MLPAMGDSVPVRMPWEPEMGEMEEGLRARQLTQGPGKVNVTVGD